MKKLLKIIVGAVAFAILFLYLVLPFVKIGEESYLFIEYLWYILDIIKIEFSNIQFTDVDVFYRIIVWSILVIIICIPVICLALVTIKAILSGVFSNRNLKTTILEIASLVSSLFLIAACYYLLNEYSLPKDANQLQITMVRIACSHIWQPLLYISAFGSLFIRGVALYANSIKKKEKKEEAVEEE